MNRVTSISHALVGTTRTFSYGYDSVGNRNFVKRDSGNGDAYDYDLNDQATTVKLNIASPDAAGAAGPQTINYDANGNRTSFAAYGTTDTYTINALSQYTSRNSIAAVYDAKGNLTTGVDGSTYTYDAQNRLLSATKAGTTDVMTYDGLNRQVSKKVGAGAVFYRVYDGWDLLGEYAVGSTSAYWAYLYGPGGVVKNLVTGKYYYQDASGSTSHLASNTGALLEWYRYDLQGKPIFYNASNTQITATANGVRHLFTGQQWYSELGLYDLRNRYYSPDIGRFLQADPISFDGDPSNLYRYCGNNAVNLSDPAGLWTFQIGLSFNFQVGFFSGNLSSGFVVDGHGNFGTYTEVFGGGGVGAKVSGGVSFAGSADADTISDLRRVFDNASMGGDAGVGGSVEGFQGTTADGRRVTGAGVTVGLGLGGGGSYGRSFTWITPLWSPRPSNPSPPPGGTTYVDPSICPECATVERVVVTGEPTDSGSSSDGGGSGTNGGGRGSGSNGGGGFTYVGGPIFSGPGSGYFGSPGIGYISQAPSGALVVGGALIGDALSGLGGSPGFPGKPQL